MAKSTKTNILQDYYQLIKPGIIRSNVMTAGAGFLFAAQGSIAWGALAGVLLGTTLIIAAGCIYNNYTDIGIDKRMERTQKRGLVTGTIPVINALILATVLVCLGFGALMLLTNWLVVLMGAIGLFFYTVVYAISKRRWTTSTLIGSVSGAASITAGYLAASGAIDKAAILLFLSMVFWQMPHFYAISLYRLNDYKNAGLPVLAVAKGVEATTYQILLYIAAFSGASLGLFVLGYTGWIYAAVMTGVIVYWLWVGIRGLQKKLNTKAWGSQMFGTSLIVLLVFTSLLAVNVWLPK